MVSRGQGLGEPRRRGDARSARPVLRSRLCLIAILLACQWAAGARAFAATPVIGISTAADPFNTAHKYFTHYASGHYWVAFETGGIGGSLNSSPDGVTWTSQGQLFPGIDPSGFANEWAIRYLGSTVIAAVFNAADSTRYYRSGTLNPDGTVTWSGALTPGGPPDATFNALNLLIANGRPIMWRDNATAGGAGAFWRGNAMASPTWTKTATDAPAMSVAGSSTGIFTAGALFQTGGANPNDLIVLRATTVTPYLVAGTNRLVAMKWNASTDTYDSTWYNVSTLGGTLTEDLTTEVQVNSDNNNQKRFAAVRDSSGNLHAVYVNRNSDMVHYKKTVGFNDSWARVSAGINPPAETINMVGLTALAGNNLYLFYSKGDNIIYYRRFDGAAWGSERTLLDLNPLTLRGVLAPPELAVDCSLGLAFVEGTLSPWNVRFTSGVGSCGNLTTSQGAGTVTVTGPGSFEMTFEQLRGGGLANFYDLAEDPTRLYDLAGKPSVNFYGLFHSGLISGGTVYAIGTNSNGAKLDLLEATPTRVRVRQEAFFQSVPPGTAILPGLKGTGDYSVYPQRVALQWNRKTTLAVPQTDHSLEISARREADARNILTLYSQSGTTFPALGGEDFVLAQREVPGVRTDFLAIQYTDWAAADTLTVATTAAYFSWRDNAAVVTPVPAGTSEKWDFLIHYKPTNFLSNVDPAVTSRSNDFRGPSALAVLVGGPWLSASENTGGGDNFNEAEGAYALTLDPALGLTFRIDGSPTPRYQPFFKIRQWRSLGGPPSVTLQGTTLVKGVDYQSDVKPISRAHWANRLAWHCTLQDPLPADTCTPSGTTDLDVGSQGGVAGGATIVAGRYGNGALVNANGQYVSAGAVGSLDFNPTVGAVEFWYQPNYAHTDGNRYLLWQNVSSDRDCFFLEHTAAGALRFAVIVEANNATCSTGGTIYSVTVPSGNYSWRPGDWVHLKTSWDSASLTKLRLFINGVEVGVSGAFDPALILSHGPTIFGGCPAGSCAQGSDNANGIIDEPHIYTGASDTPLANGGLVGAAAEYLADPSGAKNFTLGFLGIDASRRGQYLYVGADSQFRGLNVRLAAPGTGVAAGDLDWEYWNGTNWTSLESGFAFTDTTNSLTQTGSVYWIDLFNWSPYSVNGGPDLYYLRTHLAAGAAYSTFPVEQLIKTDILLFQYCGDITAAAQEFVFSPPPPPSADLSITKDDFQTAAVPGTPITYTITVTNNGPEPVTSVTVVDTVPATILGAAFAPSTGVYNSGTGLWTGLSLDTGQSVTLTLAGTIAPSATGTLVNTVMVSPPAGMVDPVPANDSAVDTDTLTPSADLSLSKTDSPDPAMVGGSLTYTLTATNNGPSTATAVVLTDTLPAGIEFSASVPGTPTCSYNSASRVLSCALGSLAPAGSAVMTVVVTAVSAGSITNTATVTRLQPDPFPANDTAAATTTVDVVGNAVRFFTVTSTSQKNLLEWLNPTLAAAPGYLSTQIVFKTTGFPSNSGDGTTLYNAGSPGARDSYLHDTPALTNGQTYYYAAFVNLSGPGVSAGRFNKGRPFLTSGPVKWAFSIGTTSLTPPGNGVGVVHAVANDNSVHAVMKGTGGGNWAPLPWRPQSMMGPSQGRPSGVPVTAGGATRVLFLGSQDGHVYAFDAESGNAAWTPSSPLLGDRVQAGPSAILSAFGGAPYDYILVGTRNDVAPNAFYALNLADGTVVPGWPFTGGAFGNVGVISGQAAVDYDNKRVYFASQAYGSFPDNNTVWCVSLVDGSAIWAKPHGNVSGGVTLRGNRLYVGPDSGGVLALETSGPSAGDAAWTFPTGGFAVKGYIMADRFVNNIYFSTTNDRVFSLFDSGAGYLENWTPGGVAITSPSIPVYAPGDAYVYVGGVGQLFRLNVGDGSIFDSYPLGDGTAVVGSPTIDLGGSFVYVGSEDGVVYAIDIP